MSTWPLSRVKHQRSQILQTRFVKPITVISPRLSIGANLSLKLIQNKGHPWLIGKQI